ncbi:hypothetical protein [Sphingomonas faeni]|uniref:hypothetical protein n=1 Tax=Sphingomonas faeni TaxID=185950 RepID=UPI0020C78882|nr:hypothetical protein [Sphingomonas faeni]MCP8889542.1 hypothetical protein [Sphingomonas faeni]
MKNGKALVNEIATTGDASWFDKNPERRLRIRAMIPGEFDDVGGPPPVGMAWRTIVLEAQPGARSRQAIALPMSMAIETLTDGDLFDLFLQVAPKGARQVIASLRKVKLPD